MHTQLILLHSELDTLKANAAKLLALSGDLSKTHTQVLFINQTAAYTDWLFAYLEELMTQMTTPNNDPIFLNKIKWFALTSDLETINTTAKKNIIHTLQRNNIQLIDELDWVTLVETANKIITIH